MMERILHSSDSFKSHKLESEQLPSGDCCAGSASQTAHDDDMLPTAISVDLQQKCFLAGFRDCRQEVLRYLIDVEHVPVEGPVVTGLEKHLTKLEMLMQTSSRVQCSCDDLHHRATASHVEEERTHAQSNDNCGASSSSRIVSATEEEEEYVCDRNITDEGQSTLNNCFQSSSMQHALISSQTVLESVASRHLCMQNNSFDSGCDSSLVSSSANSSMVTDDATTDTAVAPLLPTSSEMTNLNTAEADVSSQEPVTVTESELAENALELMHLAQNNPGISRILNELFYLMDDDYVGSDDECDDEDDDDDDDDDGVEMDNEEMESVNSENLDSV